MAAPETPPTIARIPAVDLELRVRTTRRSEGLTLDYELRSPSHRMEFRPATVRSETLNYPDAYHTNLFNQIENLRKGRDVDDHPLVGKEVATDLDTIGRLLFDRLFPQGLRDAWPQISAETRSLLIVSDEPWIPWELVKPHNEDFLCLQFRMSRWLHSSEAPASAIRILRLAAIEANGEPPLPHASEECEFIEQLGHSVGVEPRRLSDASFEDVQTLLQEGGRQLLHFVGHGEFNAKLPDESSINLSNRPLRSRHLAGPLEDRLRDDRPIVCFNICAAGRHGWSLTGLGGWTERWVRGCRSRAFLAPQWRIQDTHAAEFIKNTYNELLLHQRLGEAVRRARQSLRHDGTNNLAWLAYSLYAHPNSQVAFGHETHFEEFPADRRIEPVIIHIKQSTPDNERVTQSLSLLLNGSYRRALDVLDQELKAEPLNPRANLYYAIAKMRGINPSSLPRATVREIERHLETAAEHSSAEADALHALAIVRYEHYDTNHRQSPSPSFKELLPRLTDMRKTVNKKLLRMIHCSPATRLRLHLQ